MSQNVYLSILYSCLRRCNAVPNCLFLCILLISWRVLHCPWLSTNSFFLFTKHILHCFRLLVSLYSRWFNFLSGCGESIILFDLFRKVNSFWFLDWRSFKIKQANVVWQISVYSVTFKPYIKLNLKMIITNTVPYSLNYSGIEQIKDLYNLISRLLMI